MSNEENQELPCAAELGKVSLQAGNALADSKIAEAATQIKVTGLPQTLPPGSALNNLASLHAAMSFEKNCTEVWNNLTEEAKTAVAIHLERKLFVIDVSDADIPELKEHNERTFEILRKAGIRSPEDWVNSAQHYTDNKDIVINPADGSLSFRNAGTTVELKDSTLTLTTPKGKTVLINHDGIKGDVETTGTLNLAETKAKDSLADVIDMSIYPEDIQKLLRSLQEIIRGKSLEEVAVIINERAGKHIDPQAVSLSGIKFQLDLIKDELDEAYEALAKIQEGPSDTLSNTAALNEFLDAAIGDILLCTLGLGSRLPISAEQEYLNVCLTNLTRIPQTLDEAEATVEKFKKLGINTEIRQGINPDGSLTYPVLTPADSNVQDGLDGKKYQANYFCKGVNTFLPTAYGLKYPVTFVK